MYSLLVFLHVQQCMCYRNWFVLVKGSFSCLRSVHSFFPYRWGSGQGLCYPATHINKALCNGIFHVGWESWGTLQFFCCPRLHNQRSFTPATPHLCRAARLLPLLCVTNHAVSASRRIPSICRFVSSDSFMFRAVSQGKCCKPDGDVGIVHPKMKILSSFTHCPIILNLWLFLWSCWFSYTFRNKGFLLASVFHEKPLTLIPQKVLYSGKRFFRLIKGSSH